MYELNIPLANYPDTKTHIKSFINILDLIDYLRNIINNKIEDDWNCHIIEAIGYKIILSKNLEHELSKDYLEDLEKNYNEKDIINYIFLNWVEIQK